MESSYDACKKSFMAKAGGTDMYRCTLCGTGAFHIKIADKHFCGTRHRQSMETELGSDWILVEKKKTFSRISALGRSDWRDQVQSPLLEFLLVDSPTAELWPYSQEDGRAIVPAYIVKNLESLEKMELASLLELVAWKFSCLISGDFPTMQGILDEGIVDENFNVMKYKRQCRLSGNVGAFVERVLEFL